MKTCVFTPRFSRYIQCITFECCMLTPKISACMYMYWTIYRKSGIDNDRWPDTIAVSCKCYSPLHAYDFMSRFIVCLGSRRKQLISVRSFPEAAKCRPDRARTHEGAVCLQAYLALYIGYCKFQRLHTSTFKVKLFTGGYTPTAYHVRRIKYWKSKWRRQFWIVGEICRYLNYNLGNSPAYSGGKWWIKIYLRLLTLNSDGSLMTLTDIGSKYARRAPPKPEVTDTRQNTNGYAFAFEINNINNGLNDFRTGGSRHILLPMSVDVTGCRHPVCRDMGTSENVKSRL